MSEPSSLPAPSAAASSPQPSSSPESTSSPESSSSPQPSAPRPADPDPLAAVLADLGRVDRTDLADQADLFAAMHAELVAALATTVERSSAEGH